MKIKSKFRRGNRRRQIALAIALLAAAFSLQVVGTVFGVPNLVAIKKDILTVDNDADNLADPGDTLRYTIFVTNSGITDAGAVGFQDTIDANTTLVAGSLRTTPIARHDQYASLGNVGITVPAGSGVLLNDNDPDGTGSVTVTGIQGCGDIVAPFVCQSVNGGSVSLDADGSFTYDPPAGFEGTDQFIYTIEDLDNNIDPAVVFIVVNEVIWFIDNTAPSGGDGRFNSPFDSLSAYNSTAADDPGDIIFLHSGFGSYTSGIVLRNGQILIGQGATASIAGIAGITVPAFSNALPATGGTRPVITTSSGDGVVVAQNNTLRGFNVGNTAGVGISDNGGTVGNLAISEVAISGTGGGIEADNGGSLAVTLDGLSASSSSEEGIDLENVSGTFAVTAANGTLSMTGVPAVVVDGNPSLNIGALTFQSISSSGASRGIALRDTTGSFTITGSGTTDGSGGTIQNISSRGFEAVNAANISLSNMNFTNATTANGAAPGTATCNTAEPVGHTNTGCNAPIYLENVANVALTNLTINGSAQNGINGSNVSHFSLTNSELTNIGNENLENGIQFLNLLGTNTFNNVTVDGSRTRNALIENVQGNSTINLTNSTIDNAVGEDGFFVKGASRSGNNATITFNVTDSSFTHNHSVQLKAHAEEGSVVDVNITGNDFDGEPTVVGNSGIDLAARDNAILTFDVTVTGSKPQTFAPLRSHAVNVFIFGGGSGNGTISGNTIQGSEMGAGVRAVAEVTTSGNPSLVIEVSNNVINNVKGVGLAGIDMRSRQGVAAATGVANIQATVNNNSVGVTNTADANIQFYINSGNTLCASVTNNAASGTPFFGDAFYVGNPVSGDLAGAGTAQLSGWTGNIDTTWNNNGNTPLNSAFLDGTINGTCTPTAPTAAVLETSLASEFVYGLDDPQAESRWEPGAWLAGLAEGWAGLDWQGMADAVLVQARELAASLRPAIAHASGETINLSLGDMNPGQVVLISFDVTVDSTIPANVTQVCNQGLVTSANHADVMTDDLAVGGSTDPTCTSVPQADLSIQKSDSADPVSPGAGFSYQLSVSNSGPSTARDVFVSDTLPTGVAYVSDDCGAGPPSAGVITWNIGSMASGATAVCNISVTAPGSTGIVTNNASLASTTHDSDTSNNTASEDTAVQLPGTIIINKTTTPAGGTSFGFTDDIAAPNSFTLNDGQSKTFLNVFPGSYTVTENDPTLAYDLTGLTCDDNNSIANIGTRTATINVEAGETVTCTFSNTKRGTILVQKAASQGDPNNPNQTFTLDIRLGSVILGGLSTIQAGDPPVGLGGLSPGLTYTVNEINLAPGWTLDDISCINSVGNSTFGTFTPGDNSLEVTLAPGSTVLCTFTNLFNQPPVANDDSYSTNEDTTLVEATVGPLGDGVLANDTDADSDPLTAVLDSGPSNGSLTLNSDGSFSYEPDPDYCGPDGFSYHANDGLADSNTATVNITVNCIDDAPEVLDVDPDSQTVQYSDLIAPVTVLASDIDSDPLTISDDAPSGLSTTGSCTPDGTGGTGCSWTLSGQVLVAESSNTVEFTISDDTTSVFTETQVIVAPEDADVWFDIDNPTAVEVDSPAGTGSFSLKVYVQESSEGGASALPGDINLAQVSLTLEPIGPGTPITVACTPVTPLPPAFDYSGVLELNCGFSGVPVNAYAAVATVVGGYYTGGSEDALAVFDPSLGFTTGGGWFYWPGTSDRTTFGYTMKYKKNGRGLKGNLVLIRHVGNSSQIYRLKSNALGSLALGDDIPGDFSWAVFNGKATYQSPTMPDPEGNHTFTVYVEDHGTPGAGADRFWIEVRDKDGVLVAALTVGPDPQTDAVTLMGGNIIVPHQTKPPRRGPEAR